MNIRSFWQSLPDQLASQHDPLEAQAIGWLLIEQVTGVSRQTFRVNPDQTFTPAQWAQVQEAIVRLQAGEPIQHITGWAHFYGREFVVSPAVLIPRMETEELVVWVRDSWAEMQLPAHGAKGVDIGTGSGCIPITLDLELAQRDIAADWVGLDISEAALEVAQENAQRLNPRTRMMQGDVFAWGNAAFQELDLLISNPPYIPLAERPDLHVQVRDHEPPLALFVQDEDPLCFYRQLAKLGRHWLRRGGWMYWEIHQDQGAASVQLLKQMGYTRVELRQDLSGKDRMVRACWPDA